MENTNNIERIKELFAKVEDKKDYQEAVAKKFKLKYASIRTNWFGNRFEIPETYGIREILITFTEDYLEKQKAEAV